MYVVGKLFGPLLSCLSHSSLQSPPLVKMNNMSALEEALDILPFTISVDERGVKEAVITQLAQELCIV